MKKYLPMTAFLVFALLLLGSFYRLSPVNAQTALPLSVVPARQQLTLDPGESTSIIIKFYNGSDSPVSGFLKVADFIVEDKKGSPIFLEGPTQVSPRFAAADWVSLPYDRMTIASKDKVIVNTKITTPLDAEPGGRYIAIFFEAAPPAVTPSEDVKELAVTPRIAGLVYIRVSGPITEEARLVQFTTPRFSEYGPVPVTTEILNLGSYHIRPKGTIILTNMFGKQVDEAKLEESNIFPDASRIYENKVGQKWMLGKYKANLALSYGEAGKALTGTVFFWVFPWKMVTAVVLAVIIVILLVTITIRRFKRRQEELEARLAEEEKEIEELKEKLEKKSE